VDARTTTVSVPSPFGAVILKAAAYQTDSRDNERHLQDAALLLAVIQDPYAVREQFAGSDTRLSSWHCPTMQGVAVAAARVAGQWADRPPNPDCLTWQSDSPDVRHLRAVRI
jgi:hypothetical protein